MKKTTDESLDYAVGYVMWRTMEGWSSARQMRLLSFLLALWVKHSLPARESKPRKRKAKPAPEVSS